MSDSSSNHFVVRFKGKDGIQRLFVATATAVYPVGTALPADAAPELRATVATLESLLGTQSVAAITRDGQAPEGQMIEGQMIEGQMIEGQMIEGQMIDD